MFKIREAQLRQLFLVRCGAFALCAPIILTIASTFYPENVQAASCGVSREYHYKPAKPGALLNPYHQRMKASSYIPLAYAVNKSGGRTLEARLSAQKTLAGCRKMMSKCFKAKISKSLKDYRYCVQTNAKGRIARTIRIK